MQCYRVIFFSLDKGSSMEGASTVGVAQSHLKDQRYYFGFLNTTIASQLQNSPIGIESVIVYRCQSNTMSWKSSSIRKAHYFHKMIHDYNMCTLRTY